MERQAKARSLAEVQKNRNVWRNQLIVEASVALYTQQMRSWSHSKEQRFGFTVGNWPYNKATQRAEAKATHLPVASHDASLSVRVDLSLAATTNPYLIWNNEIT